MSSVTELRNQVNSIGFSVETLYAEIEGLSGINEDTIDRFYFQYSRRTWTSATDVREMPALAMVIKTDAKTMSKKLSDDYGNYYARLFEEIENGTRRLFMYYPKEMTLFTIEVPDKVFTWIEMVETRKEKIDELEDQIEDILDAQMRDTPEYQEIVRQRELQHPKYVKRKASTIDWLLILWTLAGTLMFLIWGAAIP